MYRTSPMPVLISERAQTTPDATAIEWLPDAARISWREVDDSSRRWAAAYRRLGVEPGDFVVTLMPNRPEAMYAFLGCAWHRAVEVPVNTEYRGEWLIHAVNTCRARVLVTSHQYLPALSPVADALDHLRLVVVYDSDDNLEHDFGSPVRVVTREEFLGDVEPATGLVEPRPWDTMAVMYTSGTTGPAKPVQMPWGMQESQHLLFSAPEFQDSTFYGFWPPFHALGKSQLAVPAMFGGKLVLRDRFSIEQFWDDVRGHGVTATYVVSVIASFLHGLPPEDDDADNPLRAVIMGPVIAEIDEFKRRFGISKVYTTFGSTEIGVALYSFMRDVTSDNWQSCGRVAEESPQEVCLVDDHDMPVGPGTPGELVVRPKVPWTVTGGYLHMPEATADVWRNGWFHTGDTFVCDENGDYQFLDRAKDYIRRRGENISSFEVEEAVCSSPDVDQAAAVAVPSDEAEDEVMVFVVPAPDVQVDPAALIGFLADRVPRFAMPRYIEVVESFPTTQATFRTQKAKLRERGPGEHTYDRLHPERTQP